MPDTAQPKIALSLTRTDKIIEIIGVNLLIGLWYFTVSHYNKLPEIIPTHFNAIGEVDGYGKKWMIVTLPLIASLLYLGITWLSRYPHAFNYAVTITEENAERQYSIVTRLFRILKVAILIIFFLIAYETVQVASDLPDVFGKWFLVIVFGLIFSPVVYFLFLSSKNA